MKSLLTATLLLLASLAMSQRVPLFNQVDVPHHYYWRELYLPQLTSGPSSVTWSREGKSLVYSMGGSLWIQEVGTDKARQLTDGDGYDYQPDYSPVRDEVVFVRYNGASMELMLLDIKSGQTTALTSNGGVNVEPRWSPDGNQLVFVSTLTNKHFLIHMASIQDGKLSTSVCITPDRKSVTPRYYYSAYDHAINPTWSADGTEIFFVTNREEPHGTGNLWAMKAADPTSLRVVQKEETTWAMRPDASRDGSRLVYSSYLGRNWHQLWLVPVGGGNPFPLTYGEYDNKNPRWSPDGKTIAFISNRNGNTALWTVEAFGGKQELVHINHRTWLKPHVHLEIKTVDATGKPVPARLSVVDPSRKFSAPTNAWIQSDDSRYPSVSPYESHYFHTDGVTMLEVPAGSLTMQAYRGHQWKAVTQTVDPSQLKGPLVITMEKLPMPTGTNNLWSGDLHVHMNYTGHYLNTPARLHHQAAAEDLNFVFDLIVNKEQRIPDIHYFSTAADRTSTPEVQILHSQEYHTSYWGHLGLLNLKEHFILPGYAGYPQTAAASLWPTNEFIEDETHAQQGLAGYVHPFMPEEIFPDQHAELTNAVPVDAALGKVDYYEVIGFADHKTSEYVWHQMLNTGLRLPAGAGTDNMANFANLRGPIGLNRVWVYGDNARQLDEFLQKLKAGCSFVSNGPLLSFSVSGATPGDSIVLTGKKQKLNFQASLRSNVPIDHLEVVMNGRVVSRLTLTGDRKTADVKGQITATGPGWVVLRAYNDQGHPELYDLYPFATTNPVFLSGKGARLHSRSAAQYFLKWIDRLDQLSSSHPAFRSSEEKAAVHEYLMRGRKYYERCLQQANAD